MPNGTITSTENTFGTVNGALSGTVAGTLTGSVGVPGPVGPTGPQGIQGPPGPPGVGGTWGSITGTLSSQTDLQTALDGKYSTTNPSGFITSAALSPYLLSSTAASTYQTIAGMSSYLTTSAAASTYAPIASPVFTGDARAVTPTFGDNDTSIATTAFVQSALSGGTAVARNLEVEVRNQSGSTIAAGSIVYISGATGNKPLITLAQANNDANSAQTIGFVKTSIANNGTGFVIVRGELENIDTSALTEGVQLYLSPTTAGTWTTTKPSAPQHLVYVGIVIRSHPTLGTILVAVQNGYELDELHDVKITSPTNGQVLKYDSAQSLWVNGTDSAPVTSVAGRTGAITLSNTDISGLGTISTFNDAPSNGSTYGRQNGAWVVTGGGGSFTGGAITSPITYTVGTQVSTMANTGFSVANSATSESIDVIVTGINITSDAATINLNGDGAIISVSGVYGVVNINSGGIQYPDASFQSTAGIGDAPADGATYVRNSSAWIVATFIPDAPSDGNYYVRMNGAWIQCTVVSIFDSNTTASYNCLTV